MQGPQQKQVQDKRVQGMILPQLRVQANDSNYILSSGRQWEVRGGGRMQAFSCLDFQGANLLAEEPPSALKASMKLISISDDSIWGVGGTSITLTMKYVFHEAGTIAVLKTDPAVALGAGYMVQAFDVLITGNSPKSVLEYSFGVIAAGTQYTDARASEYGIRFGGPGQPTSMTEALKNFDVPANGIPGEGGKIHVAEPLHLVIADGFRALDRIAEIIRDPPAYDAMTARLDQLFSGIRFPK